MSRAKPTDQERLDLVVANAQRLRDAGVARVQLGDLSFELYPAQPAMPTEEEMRRSLGTLSRAPSDPLDDPATFGLMYPGAKAPGFRRDQEEDNE